MFWRSTHRSTQRLLPTDINLSAFLDIEGALEDIEADEPLLDLMVKSRIIYFLRWQEVNNGDILP